MDRSYIDRVIQLARQAKDIHEFPVGALVVKNGDIIGEGFNQKETQQSPMAHAEVLAIQAAAKQLGSWRLLDTILVSTLEPCPMCLGAIIQARIPKIVFLAKDIRWGACGSIMDFAAHSKLNHHCEYEYLPNVEVVDLMTTFFKNKRNR